jgi:protein CpxP
MTRFRHTARQAAAAVLLAVGAATACSSAAFAADDAAIAVTAAATAAAAGGQAQGRGPDGDAPDDYGGPRPGAPGLAAPSHAGGPPHAGFGLFGRLHRLDLSEAQQDKLFALMHAAAPRQRNQEKAERKAHDALRALGGSAQFDEARASTAARDLGQAIADGVLLRARLASQALALLTPEQREQLRRDRPPGLHERP